MIYFHLSTLWFGPFFCGDRASFKIGARVGGGPLDPIRERGSHPTLEYSSLPLRVCSMMLTQDEAIKKITIEEVKMGRGFHTSMVCLCFLVRCMLIRRLLETSKVPNLDANAY
jgi:hypothetical protein